jgi:hypothetical protein
VLKVESLDQPAAVPALKRNALRAFVLIEPFEAERREPPVGAVPVDGHVALASVQHGVAVDRTPKLPTLKAREVVDLAAIAAEAEPVGESEPLAAAQFEPLRLEGERDFVFDRLGARAGVELMQVIVVAVRSLAPIHADRPQPQRHGAAIALLDFSDAEPWVDHPLRGFAADLPGPVGAAQRRAVDLHSPDPEEIIRVVAAQLDTQAATRRAQFELTRCHDEDPWTAVKSGIRCDCPRRRLRYRYARARPGALAIGVGS